MRRVFVCFLEEIEDSKKAFQNYLTFSDQSTIQLQTVDHACYYHAQNQFIPHSFCVKYIADS